MSLHSRFITVNQTLRNIVGYTAEEFNQLTFQEFTSAEYLSMDLEYVQQLLEGKTDTYQMEKCYIRKDKGIVLIQLSASLFKCDDGSPHFFISQIEEITHLKLRDYLIQQDIYFNALIASLNRKLLMDRLQYAMEQAVRYERAIAVLFLDLDHFNVINDTLGHDEDDLILKESAAPLVECICANDKVARLSDDQFVIVLSEIRHANGEKLLAGKYCRNFRWRCRLMAKR